MRKFYVITSDGESYATTRFEQFHRLAEIVGEVSQRMSPGASDVFAPAEPVTNHEFQEVST